MEFVVGDGPCCCTDSAARVSPYVRRRNSLARDPRVYELLGKNRDYTVVERYLLYRVAAFHSCSAMGSVFAHSRNCVDAAHASIRESFAHCADGTGAGYAVTDWSGLPLDVHSPICGSAER